MLYQPIEHTADIGFKVWGKTVPNLFENAAFALTDSMVASGQLEPDKTVFVRLKAESLEELLVAWLEEILFLFETQNFVGLRFQVSSADLKDFKAVVHGAEWDEAKQPLKTQIKAVTFHELEISQREGRYETRVILDV